MELWWNSERPPLELQCLLFLKNYANNRTPFFIAGSSSSGSVGSHFDFACTQDEVSDMLSDFGVSAETDWVDNLIAI